MISEYSRTSLRSVFKCLFLLYMFKVIMGSSGLTLADLPNIFIMIAALISLFIVLVIFLRNMEVIGLVGEGSRNDQWGRSMEPPQLLMQRVHIPFTFKLLEDKPVSYDGVHCSISSTVRYWSASWWGAPVRELHTTLWGSLPEILASRPFVKSNPHEETSQELRPNEPLQLGKPPRNCYPLVVILARDERDTKELRPDDTVALVSVIHIQDEQCPLPSGIIAQYLKQANGHLSCLKRLYVTGERECGECGEDRIGAALAGGALCCVCAARPLSRALLPCRHACLCADCLSKLDKCPICRSIITSYFCIRNDDDSMSELKQQRYPLNRRIFNLFHYH